MSAAWKSLVVLALVIAARSPAADPPPVGLPLTQFEVLGLLQQGLSDDAVIAKLRETKSTFRLTENEKQMLKALGVSSRVLNEMASSKPRPGQIQRTVEVMPDGQTMERIGVDFNTPPVVPASAIAPAPSRPAGPVGTWYRHIGSMLFVLKVGPDHLTATMTQTATVDSRTVAMGMTFSGDYALSKDGGTLHGLITGMDVVTEGELPDGDLGNLGEQIKKFGAMNDQPFAFSFRVQDGELMIRNVRVAGPTDNDLREPFEMLAGRYKTAGDKPVPKPKPMQPQQTHLGGMTLPPSQQVIPPVQSIPMPYPSVTGAPVVQQLPIPPLVGAPVSQQLPPPPLPPSPGPVQQATYSDRPYPVMTAPPTPSVPAPSPSPAGSKLTGTWVREFDGMQVVLKLTDKRLFATLNIAYVEEGKPGEMRMAFRADADYAVGPDGTLFGVVTGTDFTPPKDENAGMADAPKMMTGLNGLPYCFRFRIDEGMLSVRDLRCGALDMEASSVAVQGRYIRTEKEPAPPKAVKMPKGCDGPQCQPPMIRYASDPASRMDQLMNQSFQSGPPGEIAPAPRPVPAERLHGGIIN